MKSSQQSELAVVIPIHNEADILHDAILAFTKKITEVAAEADWHYVLVENGSTDCTAEILQQLKKIRPSTKIIRIPSANYGNALRTGLLAAQSDWCLIMNIDHLWDAKFFSWAWRCRHDFSLVLASKRADLTLNKQGRYRHILSTVLNFLLQSFCGSVVTDTHGMKLLHLMTLRPLIQSCVMRRGQFDTELTLRTLRAGHPVAEVPIPYIEKRKPRNLMARKIIQNVYDLFRLYLIMRNVPYCGSGQYRRFNRSDLSESEND
jgi:glycosyltransferase involved in cell wall biosynthesis